MNSKEKGKRGERELAEILTSMLAPRRFVRSAQVSGQYTADIIALDENDLPVPFGLHIECKRNEKLNIYEAVNQAVHDSKGGIPTVMHRRNNQEWLVTIRLADLLKFKEALHD